METEIVSREAHETKYRCSACGVEHLRKNQRYCNSCHAQYQRDWRPRHEEKKIAKLREKILEELKSSFHMNQTIET